MRVLFDFRLYKNSEPAFPFGKAVARIGGFKKNTRMFFQSKNKTFCSERQDQSLYKARTYLEMCGLLQIKAYLVIASHCAGLTMYLPSLSFTFPMQMRAAKKKPKRTTAIRAGKNIAARHAQDAAKKAMPKKGFPR